MINYKIRKIDWALSFAKTWITGMICLWFCKYVSISSFFKGSIGPISACLKKFEKVISMPNQLNQYLNVWIQNFLQCILCSKIFLCLNQVYRARVINSWFLCLIKAFDLHLLIIFKYYDTITGFSCAFDCHFWCGYYGIYVEKWYLIE